jgi:spore coat protein U-like protein
VKNWGLLCAVVAVFGTVPASAENIGYRLNTQVTPVCGAFSADGPVVDVDFGELSAVPSDQVVQRRAGTVTYRCNTTVGYTRTIASQNSGYLTLDGNPTTDDARRIAFTMRQTGAHGFARRQFSVPLTTFHPVGRNSNAILRGNGGIVFFEAFGVRANSGGGTPTTTVFAGNYRDTVSVTVTAN